MSDLKKVNLPKTSFSMKANLPGKEPLRLNLWKKNNIYNKVLEQNKNNEYFVLHDGPPYANGHIHLGHALNKILKDIIIKYEALNGKYTPYIPGWDCHGLPIEFQLFKELKGDKNSIDQVEFRKRARKFAMKFVNIQKEEFIRLGIWGDFNNPYLTLDPKYEKSIIHMFKELVKKDYIYRGKKPVYWCASCETALAEAEIEYDIHKSKSIYVKFPVVESNEVLKNIKDVSVLIWTTTPWTLPANMAVAFNKDAEYSIIKVTETSDKNIKVGEHFVVARELLSKVLEKINVTKYEEINLIKGEVLKGTKVLSPFRKESSIGILADFVTLEDGTGIVHIAPGHGHDDYIAGLAHGLDIYNPVDDKGHYIDEIELFGGKHVFAANSEVVNVLKERSLLLNVSDLEHNYPHCWRCKTPIIFRATDQWFLDVDKNNLRDKLINSCQKVKWIPEFGYKRITSMLEVRPHWCLSRQRLWGTPIPVFYCLDCNKELLTNESIEAVENLFECVGSDAWFYKAPQDILPSNIKCSCGSRNFKKETDILDVWFDSAVSHQFVLKDSRKLPWPADLYLEGSDQHRGWFQSSLIVSVAVYGEAPYKTVLTHGFTVDVDGKKMSKSLGNVISPQEITNKYGADVLRLMIASENYREDMRISETLVTQIVDAYRKMRNTFRYLMGNLKEFDYTSHKVDYKDLIEIDKWALLKLKKLWEEIKESYESRELHQVFRKFYNFCTKELSSLYFDILKDRLYTEGTTSLERRSAQTVLYYMLTFLIRMIAPIMPFTAEEIWEKFDLKENREIESIFLENYPGYNSLEKELIEEWNEDDSFLNKWDKIFKIRSVLLKKIEDVRLKGIIGNSLEAKIIIYLNKEVASLKLDKNSGNFWNMIAIVSQTEIKVEDVSASVLVDSKELPEDLKEISFGVEVKKADGQKCERCWNFRTSVGQNDKYKDLCSRCIKVVENWEK